MPKLIPAVTKGRAFDIGLVGKTEGASLGLAVGPTGHGAEIGPAARVGTPLVDPEDAQVDVKRDDGVVARQRRLIEERFKIRSVLTENQATWHVHSEQNGRQ